MKKLILAKLGTKGLIHMLQVFIFALICVGFHTLLIPQFIGILPIALLMGIISIQPTSGFTKKAMSKIGVMFVFACVIVGISSVFFDMNVYVYFVVMVVALLVINFMIPQKYMVITMAIGTALFFLDTSDMNAPYWVVLIIMMLDVALFFIVVRLIVRFVHIPVEKSIQIMMKQTMALLQKELHTMLVKKEAGKPKPLYGIFVQSQMLIHEYGAGKQKDPAHVEIYKKTLASYLQAYFSLLTISELGEYNIDEAAKEELRTIGMDDISVVANGDPILTFHIKEFAKGIKGIRGSIETLDGGEIA
ncbi:hypothetical protein PWEIH_01440 [Listeria weihenstephanensis FSL R9-0317]|uniref:Membrane protein n=1 Tax=Listeria weihenstephanensis TaxID=1006155 RepID=A0A1S7FWC7_9LIST|nr:hypothetical protein [Listeria weihenstephanensis]AQY51699.1 membrane protein [Listeria weihenstephanensis]EUJ41288.1 hypothetical protein PWEIH_01440 [Listeria weihenstephanensis FSL R9-0317]